MASIQSAFRDAPLLGADRARAWCLVMALCAVVVVSALVFMTHGGVRPDPWGRPLATDVSSFWTAAKLALAGSPAAVWNPAAHEALQRASFPQQAGYAPDYYAFFYPPPFLLIWLPLGLLPYNAALALWLVVTSLAYGLVIRRLLPKRWPAALIVIAFPAFLLNAEHGQNGALSAALFGMAALHLDRRPGLAGACLGALCFKPQLALLVLPGLLLALRWRALALAVGTGAAMCAVSWAVFGTAAWIGFFADLHLARAALEAGWVGFQKMTSPFAAVRLLGGGIALAGVVQWIVSLAALGVVAFVARRRPGAAAAEVATMATASCLATPFLLDYDLMLLAVPLAWVASMADGDRFLPWEKTVLAAGFVLPMVARAIAWTVGIPITPVVVSALLAVVVRRAWLAGSGARPVPYAF
jgi:hypothetical protein